MSYESDYDKKRRLDNEAKLAKFKKNLKLGGIAFGALFALLFLTPFTTIGTGQRGVVTHFGKVQGEILDEGFHLRMPILTSIKKISVRVQKSDLKTQASSKDLQLVTSEVAINWHVNPSEVANLYQNVGDEDDVVTKVLTPLVSEVFKSTTATKTAEEIITKRSELAEESEKGLRAGLAKYGLILDNVSIVDLDFTAEFAKAVEHKQIAEQQAKQAEYVAMQATANAKAEVNKAKGDAEATLTRARAQAESQKLLRLTVTPEILQQQAIEKWNGEFPQVMGSGTLPFLNLNLKNGGASATK